jgi:NhaA family Na+:H+ antiporter
MVSNRRTKVILRRGAQGISFLLENSLFLVGGAVIGLIWANVAHESYEELHHTLHFVVNDILMVFFFAIAGKEIREAMLPGGSLSSPRKASLPLIATAGGMLGPALFFILGAQLIQPELTRGWAIPCATDIAFSYMVARFIFGKGHPAIAFLLLLAIADDAGGLIILATCYPTGEMSLLAFAGLAGGAIALALVMYKVLKLKSFWWYIIGPGTMSWFGFYLGGIHPALAMVSLMWCMPHEESDLGLFREADSGHHKTDALNKFEHWMKSPVELVLGAFALVNAGVVMSALGNGTWLVLAGLLLGKPIGIFFCTKLGNLFGLEMPEGMNNRALIVVGFAAGIGFTVALFVSTVAFPAGALQDSVKMGALFSLGVLFITIAVAYVLRVGRFSRNPTKIKPVQPDSEWKAA